MATLSNLRAAADSSESAFHGACKSAGYPDHWEAYRAHDRGEVWPAAVESAWQAHRAALHTFYETRDGPNGFLGARGA